MSLEKVNVVSIELDEPLDEAGFCHVAATVGLRLGAQRIGASVYEGEAGLPIWPYHSLAVAGRVTTAVGGAVAVGSTSGSDGCRFDVIVGQKSRAGVNEPR